MASVNEASHKLMLNRTSAVALLNMQGGRMALKQCCVLYHTLTQEIKDLSEARSDYSASVAASTCISQDLPRRNTSSTAIPGKTFCPSGSKYELSYNHTLPELFHRPALTSA